MPHLRLMCPSLYFKTDVSQFKIIILKKNQEETQIMLLFLKYIKAV